MAPWIISHFPKHRIYVEPFGGGASVLLRKSRSYAEVYNDLDGDVVNFFRVMRDRSDDFIPKLRMTPFAREEHQRAYDRASDPVERARQSVIRSFMGFGSSGHNRSTGFRGNSNRSGTIPAHDWKNYVDAAQSLAERLRGVVIENRPAIDVMSQQDHADALHYVDPPYVHETRCSGHEYRHELTDSDHEELLTQLQGLEGAVIVSGYRCELYDDMLSDWVRVDRAALADGARARVESLWLSFDTNQGRLFA